MLRIGCLFGCLACLFAEADSTDFVVSIGIDDPNYSDLEYAIGASVVKGQFEVKPQMPLVGVVYAVYKDGRIINHSDGMSPLLPIGDFSGNQPVDKIQFAFRFFDLGNSRSKPIDGPKWKVDLFLESKFGPVREQVYLNSSDLNFSSFQASAIAGKFADLKEVFPLFYLHDSTIPNVDFSSISKAIDQTFGKWLSEVSKDRYVTIFFVVRNSDGSISDLDDLKQILEPSLNSED